MKQPGDGSKSIIERSQSTVGMMPDEIKQSRCMGRMGFYGGLVCAAHLGHGAEHDGCVVRQAERPGEFEKRVDQNGDQEEDLDLP